MNNAKPLINGRENMMLAWNDYINVLKRNGMLILIILALLFFTFGFWFGIPFFTFSALLAKWNVPIVLSEIIIYLLIGTFMSIYFIPLHLKFVQQRSTRVSKNKFRVLFFSQLVMILFGGGLSAVTGLIIRFLAR